MSKKNNALVRSSAAEYLTFIAAKGEGGVEAIYANENIWLTQKMMGELYHVATHTINYHLKKIFSDSELQEDSVVRNFRITAKYSQPNLGYLTSEFFRILSCYLQANADGCVIGAIRNRKK